MKVRDVMQRGVQTVDVDAPAVHALQTMMCRRFRHLPVLEGDRLAGVVTERDLLASRPADPEGAVNDGRLVRDVMTAPAAHTHPDEGLADAAARMSVERLGCLPVLDGGAVVGILTRTDLLAAMARSPVVAPPGPTSTVGDYMTRDVLALRPDTHLIDAAASMVQRGVRHAPVIDGMNRVVGVLSDRDVRSAIGDLRAVLSEAALPSRLKRLRVQQAMTSDPRTLTVDEPLADAVVVFLGERFGAMPVVDEAERLVGILSYVDVLAAVARAHPERMD